MTGALISFAMVLTVGATPPVQQGLPDGVPIVNPPPESRALRTTTRALMAASIVTAGIDYGVTEFALGTGQFREVNPLLRWAEDRPVAMGVTKLGVAVARSYLLLRQQRRHPWITLIVASAFVAIDVAVIRHNLRAIERR